jgi:hypothetical protein
MVEPYWIHAETSMIVWLVGKTVPVASLLFIGLALLTHWLLAAAVCLSNSSLMNLLVSHLTLAVLTVKFQLHPSRLAPFPSRVGVLPGLLCGVTFGLACLCLSPRGVTVGLVCLRLSPLTPGVRPGSAHCGVTVGLVVPPFVPV